jgi:hypothetical protein
VEGEEKTIIRRTVKENEVALVIYEQTSQDTSRHNPDHCSNIVFMCVSRLSVCVYRALTPISIHQSTLTQSDAARACVQACKKKPALSAHQRVRWGVRRTRPMPIMPMHIPISQNPKSPNPETMIQKNTPSIPKSP